MKELLQRYLDDNKMHSFEGERGIKQMEQVMRNVCGYNDPWSGTLRDFFADNSGAIQAVIEWIGAQHNADWKEHLEDLVGEDDSEGEYYAELERGYARDRI